MSRGEAQLLVSSELALVCGARLAANQQLLPSRCAERAHVGVPGRSYYEASVFETTIRVVGGILTAHELTGDAELLRRCALLRRFPAAAAAAATTGFHP